jgi:hypothetical protein
MLLIKHKRPDETTRAGITAVPHTRAAIRKPKGTKQVNVALAIPKPERPERPP